MELRMIGSHLISGKRNIGQYFNSGTTVEIFEQCNHLPGDVVSSSSVNIFKGRLHNYLRSIGGFK